MSSIIKAEFFKYFKNRWIYCLILMALFPLLFGFALFLDLPSMKIHALFTLSSFIDSMWSFMITTTLPILFFSYIATQFGESIRTGQIIYEMTRVSNRQQLIKHKIYALCLLVILFFISVILIASLSFYIFIHGSRFGLPLDVESVFSEEIVGMILGMSYLIFFILLSLYGSFFISGFSMVISNFVITIIISFISTNDLISRYVPGSIIYGAYIPEDQFNYYVVYQGVCFVFLIFFLSLLSINKFKKIDVA